MPSLMRAHKHDMPSYLQALSAILKSKEKMQTFYRTSRASNYRAGRSLHQHQELPLDEVITVLQQAEKLLTEWCTHPDIGENPAKTYGWVQRDNSNTSASTTVAASAVQPSRSQGR
jgi:hypothetical protein